MPQVPYLTNTPNAHSYLQNAGVANTAYNTMRTAQAGFELGHRITKGISDARIERNSKKLMQQYLKRGTMPSPEEFGHLTPVHQKAVMDTLQTHANFSTARTRQAAEFVVGAYNWLKTLPVEQREAAWDEVRRDAQRDPHAAASLDIANAVFTSEGPPDANGQPTEVRDFSDQGLKMGYDRSKAFMGANKMVDAQTARREKEWNAMPMDERAAFLRKRINLDELSPELQLFLINPKAIPKESMFSALNDGKMDFKSIRFINQGPGWQTGGAPGGAPGGASGHIADQIKEGACRCTTGRSAPGTGG